MSNASIYDGATAATEAVLMAVNATGRSRVVTATSVHPEYRQVVAAYVQNLGTDLVTLGTPRGIIDPEEIGRRGQRADSVRPG